MGAIIKIYQGGTRYKTNDGFKILASLINLKNKKGNILKPKSPIPNFLVVFWFKQCTVFSVYSVPSNSFIQTSSSSSLYFGCTVKQKG